MPLSVPRACSNLRSSGDSPKDYGDMAEASNGILAQLTTTNDGGLLAALRHVTFDTGLVLQPAGSSIEYCYFPTAGLVSLIVRREDGFSVECATVDSLSGVNLTAALHDAPAGVEAVVQVRGSAWLCPVTELRAAYRRSDALRHALYVAETHLAELSQLNVFCAALHQAGPRLARLLLRADDESKGNTLVLTQDFIGQLLGLRRPTLSVAASEFKSKSIIEYQRGIVKIQNRDALERESCSCYRHEHERAKSLAKRLVATPVETKAGD